MIKSGLVFCVLHVYEQSLLPASAIIVMNQHTWFIASFPGSPSSLKFEKLLEAKVKAESQKTSEDVGELKGPGQIQASRESCRLSKPKMPIIAPIPNNWLADVLRGQQIFLRHGPPLSVCFHLHIFSVRKKDNGFSNVISGSSASAPQMFEERRALDEVHLIRRRL